MKRKMSTLMGAALVLSMALPAAALAECTSTEREEVEQKVNLTKMLMESKGMTFKEDHYDCSSTKKWEKFTISNLNPGKLHVFVVVGSKYAKDIDSKLLSEGGEEIDTDRASDATPIVQVHAPFTMKVGLHTRVYNNDVSDAQIAIIHFYK